MFLIKAFLINHTKCIKEEMERKGRKKKTKCIMKLVSVAGAVIPCVWEAVSSGWCEVVQGVGSDYIVVWGQHRVCQ